MSKAMKEVRMKIDSCFDCGCLDDGGALIERFYCNHMDAKKASSGKLIEFDAGKGIPDWCPYDEVKKEDQPWGVVLFSEYGEGAYCFDCKKSAESFYKEMNEDGAYKESWLCNIVGITKHEKDKEG
jgi:hypothetical protein